MVALVDGFHLLDFDSGGLEFLVGPQHVPGTRFNDGKVAPDGRFWAGTMDEERCPGRSPCCTGWTRTTACTRWSTS